MVVSSRVSIRCQVKSISLPCRSHPSTLRIEQELNAAKTNAVTAKPSAETICSGLSQLTVLYECMDDLLNSSATRVLFAREQNMKFVNDLIDESMKFLDVCGGIREMVSHMKEHIRDLQCALRRRKGELSTEKSVTKYNCFRKKMKKDVKGLVASLKQVDSNIMTIVDSDDHHLAAVIKAVLGVSEMTVSGFEGLLSFFSMPISKPNRLSLVVSKLIHKGMVACEEQQEQGVLNELDSIDAALQTICKDESSAQSDKMQIAKCRLERVEVQLEGMESRLECMFRHLIRNRATLLNIISQ